MNDRPSRCSQKMNFLDPNTLSPFVPSCSSSSSSSSPSSNLTRLTLRRAHDGKLRAFDLSDRVFSSVEEAAAFILGNSTLHLVPDPTHLPTQETIFTEIKKEHPTGLPTSISQLGACLRSLICVPLILWAAYLLSFTQCFIDVDLNQMSPIFMLYPTSVASQAGLFSFLVWATNAVTGSEPGPVSPGWIRGGSHFYQGIVAATFIIGSIVVAKMGFHG